MYSDTGASLLQDLLFDFALFSLQNGKVKPVHVVDVPGHARLKPKLDEFLPQAAGVVFVVDAQDFLSSMQAAAE
jgi:signal recognition particle receptor subunit beta